MVYKKFVKTALLRTKSITNPRFGKNEARIRRIGFDFFAELADEYSQIFMLLREISSPDRAEQRAMCEDFACVPHKMGQKVEFFGSQMHLNAATHDNVSVEIDAKFTGLDDASLRICCWLPT